MNKHYLGDGVYIAYNSYDFELTTENGVEISNQIVLDPQVVTALINYIKHTWNVNSI